MAVVKRVENGDKNLLITHTQCVYILCINDTEHVCMTQGLQNAHISA